MTDHRLVLINEADNVMVCCEQIVATETIDIAGQNFVVQGDINVGHKVARFAICAGEKIIKYGVPIGSATQSIKVAEHVHLHNTKSDYIPSHTRDKKAGVGS